MIPKRIIQTWKSRELPKRYRAFDRRLRKLHPDYEFRFFTDGEMDEFVRQEYPEYCEGFDALPDIISKVDLFRLLAVHKLGGFYMDLDVSMRKSLDDLRDHACIFPFERCADPYFAALHGTVDMIGQFAFGARAGHPFLKACADNIRRASLDPDSLRLPTEAHLPSLPPMFGNAHSFRVLYAAGPGMITRTFIEAPESRADARILSAIDRKDRRKVKFCFGNYGVHHMTGSWLAEMSPSDIKAARFVAKVMSLRHARILRTAEPAVTAELAMVDGRGPGVEPNS